ncbi:hypothetical protein HAX54_046201, partial [Datura stramonium]|nr:hypothetical protein [Datura stramonium]
GFGCKRLRLQASFFGAIISTRSSKLAESKRDTMSFKLTFYDDSALLSSVSSSPKGLKLGESSCEAWVPFDSQRTKRDFGEEWNLRVVFWRGRVIKGDVE